MQMIEVAYGDLNAKMRLESIRHADLKVSILNAPYSRRSDDKLYKIDDFLDDETKKELYPKRGVTQQKQSSVWSGAGHACIEQYAGLK